MIIICPYCHSNNVVYWQEFNITKVFKLKKDGTPYKRTKNHYDTSFSMPYGYECEDCGEWDSYDEMEKWIFMEEKC